jgi:hypothetical protein
MALALTRWVGRAIGLDVHRDFCVVAICEDGNVRSAGRVPSTPDGLRLLAESLLPTDRGQDRSPGRGAVGAVSVGGVAEGDHGPAGRGGGGAGANAGA